MLNIIIEENCTVPPRNTLLENFQTVKDFLQSIVDKCSLPSLEYIVFTDSEQENFNVSVKKYAALIGAETNITDNEGYQTAAKSIDGINSDGVYKQAIIVKGMIMSSMICDLLRLMGTLPPEFEKETETIKYISLTTIIHEIGHAIDNLYQYNREGYCDDQIAFDLSIKEEYQKYIYRSALGLWGEYYAERFCYEILGRDLSVNKEEVLIECMKQYSIGAFGNQITERVHMILYCFVHRLGCLHSLGKVFDYNAIKENGYSEYIQFLRKVDELTQKIFDTLPKWDEGLFDEFICVYHDMLMHEKGMRKRI